VVIAGLFFFLVSTSFNFIFIPTLDVPGDGCEKWDEKRIGYRTAKDCVAFKTELDELKYHHNQKMEKRQTTKLHGLFLSATLLTFLIMLLSPGKFIDHKITMENYTGAIAVAVFYGVIIGFLLPVALEAMLPAPEEWLPDEFFEIKQARIEWVLKDIQETLNTAQHSNHLPV
jgi:hypothetical protein